MDSCLRRDGFMVSSGREIGILYRGMVLPGYHNVPFVYIYPMYGVCVVLIDYFILW